jgi:hypothetical protein
MTSLPAPASYPIPLKVTARPAGPPQSQRPPSASKSVSSRPAICPVAIDKHDDDGPAISPVAMDLNAHDGPAHTSLAPRDKATCSSLQQTLLGDQTWDIDPVCKHFVAQYMPDVKAEYDFNATPCVAGSTIDRAGRFIKFSATSGARFGDHVRFFYSGASAPFRSEAEYVKAYALGPERKWLAEHPQPPSPWQVTGQVVMVGGGPHAHPSMIAHNKWHEDFRTVSYKQQADSKAAKDAEQYFLIQVQIGNRIVQEHTVDATTTYKDLLKILADFMAQTAITEEKKLQFVMMLSGLDPTSVQAKTEGKSDSKSSRAAGAAGGVKSLQEPRAKFSASGAGVKHP